MKRTTNISSLVLTIVCILLCATAQHLHAQSVGTIAGSVTDPSGAFVSGAVVTVSNERTSLSQSVKTDSQGQYTLKLLHPASIN